MCVTVLSKEVTLFFHILLCLSNAHSHSVGETLRCPLQLHQPLLPHATQQSFFFKLFAGIMFCNFSHSSVLVNKTSRSMHATLFKISLWLLLYGDCWVARIQWSSSVFKELLWCKFDIFCIACTNSCTFCSLCVCPRHQETLKKDGTTPTPVASKRLETSALPGFPWDSESELPAGLYPLLLLTTSNLCLETRIK